MSTVFEADDLRHRRRVAIKVLRSDLASAVGADRFQLEIETSANLRHPHIVPLFDSGGVGDVLFYVMPLIAGESLRARLQREGQLPVDDAVRIARQVGGALDYAHERGVVHRDIKPENILLERGHAVITDFGIARVVSAARSANTLTQAGTSLGTPAYMSPEQIAGEQDLDGRSDQYSLGCTLYEMLAGHPPFTGTTLERLYYQQLMETPPPVSQFRSAVPAHVVTAIRRALAKSRHGRFETASAFVTALTMPVPDRGRARAVAVLPFLNFSTDPENEHFADGMTEDVIAQLSKIGSLRVVSRTSVMPFKKREQGLKEIASGLNVESLVDGSVRRAGSRVRIVAQLIDAATEQHLWSETYDRELTDIFAIQSEVALHIAHALEAELTSDERARIERPPTADVHAYQFFLLGRHNLVMFTRDSLRRSLTLFQGAIERDPSYAAAWAGVAMAWTELGELAAEPPDTWYPAARSAAQRAIELDDELADAHCQAAFVKLVYEFDWSGAEAEFRRALELNPSHADAWDLYGRLCSAQGRHDEAITMQQRARELDPLTHKFDVATTLLRAGRYEEAVQAAREGMAFDVDGARGNATLGWGLILLGRVDEGITALERSVADQPDEPIWLAQLGQAYAMSGMEEKARRVLHRLEVLAETRFVSPYHLAYTYTGLGDYDRAVELLEQAVERRTGAVYGLGGTFLFAPLRSHPGFIALLRRMHLEGREVDQQSG
jgi:serine/threonine-protein kinase